MAAMIGSEKKNTGRGGIRTHAIEMTGALNQRLRPLGHPTTCWRECQLDLRTSSILLDHLQDLCLNLGCHGNLILSIDTNETAPVQNALRSAL